jgi:CheY-like chemotaxis protein
MPKLLIVDDETALLQAITRALAAKASEFIAFTATSAEEALELLQTQSIDVLLTDVRLPGMDGIELVRRALATDPAMKVIVMTALHSPDIQARAMKGGALRFIKKPFSLADMIALLRETVGGGWSGSVTGLDIFDLTQLLAMTERSRSVRVSAGAKAGVLVLEDGQLTHATANGRSGPEAFYEMVGWEGGLFEDISQADGGAYPRNVDVSTTHLIMEAARLRDEKRLAASATPAPTGSKLEGQLKKLVAGGGCPCDVCVLGADGSVLARHNGRPGARRPLDGLTGALRAFASASERRHLRRLLVEDDEETVVLCDMGDSGARLLLVADSGPKVGEVLAEARRLAQALQGEVGSD